MLLQYCFNGVHITLKGRIFDVNFYYVDNLHICVHILMTFYIFVY